MVLPAMPGGRGAAILEAMRANGGSATRTEIARALGVARATLIEGLSELEESGIVVQSSVETSAGGRPARTFAINVNRASIGIIDVGGSRTRVGLANLEGDVVQESALHIAVEVGPEEVLNWAVSELQRMQKSFGQSPVPGVVVIGLPGPVDFTTGSVVRPPMMRNWQGFDVRGFINSRIKTPVIIDNDVNLIAIAEQRISYPSSQVFLVLKLGTGIGGALVIHDRPLRGANGAAGDIGHTQSIENRESMCRCGQNGCVEAVAGGWALVQQLERQGVRVDSVTDVAKLAKEGNVIALSAVRTASKVVGQAAAQAVSLLNPDTLVVAGELLGAGDTVIASIRETIYQYSLPLATHDLTVKPSTLGPLVGLKGGAQLGIDYLFGRVEFLQLSFTNIK
jgi:predicted NBD/HSP70 family sugar kinase